MLKSAPIAGHFAVWEDVSLKEPQFLFSTIWNTCYNKNIESIKSRIRSYIKLSNDLKERYSNIDMDEETD